MNVATILIPLLTDLVEKVISNQFSKQHLNDQIAVISNTVDKAVVDSHVEKSSQIQILEQKLKDLTDKLDVILNLKVDEIVKKVQDKTPFFLDPIVSKFGDEIKNQINVFSHDADSKVLDFLEQKAKDMGLEPLLEAAGTFIGGLGANLTPSPTIDPKAPVTDVSVTTHPPAVEGSLDFLSEKANEILQDLKNSQKS